MKAKKFFQMLWKWEDVKLGFKATLALLGTLIIWGLFMSLVGLIFNFTTMSNLAMTLWGVVLFLLLLGVFGRMLRFLKI